MKREDIVALSAELAKYTDLHILGSATPGRFCPMGMAEQLLMSAAARWGGIRPLRHH